MQASAGIMIAATILLVARIAAGRASDRRLARAGRRARRLAAARRTHVPTCRPTRSVALPAPTGRIEVERLAYAFAPSRPALIRNVSFTLAAGESLGVIGAERVRQDHADPSAARPVAAADGRACGSTAPTSSRWDRDALGAHIGYLPQDVELFAGTVGENIARLGAIVRRRKPRSASFARRGSRTHTK